MRILVLSDSHGDRRCLQTILDRHADIDRVFFLGDLTRDIESIAAREQGRQFSIVSGNCDFASLYPESNLAEIADVKIFFTHGHTLGVKAGTARLFLETRLRGCALGLYGHTHTPAISYENGVYLVNPGSCARPRSSAASYAVIDLAKEGVMPSIMEV